MFIASLLIGIVALGAILWWVGWRRPRPRPTLAPPLYTGEERRGARSITPEPDDQPALLGTKLGLGVAREHKDE